MASQSSTSQQQLWWFLSDKDRLVLQRDFNKKYQVSDQLLRRTEVSLDSWKTVDKDFQSLAGDIKIQVYPNSSNNDVNDTSNDGTSGSSSETPLQQPAKKPKHYKDKNCHVFLFKIIQQQGEEIISLKAENGILKAENDRLKTLLSDVEQTNASDEEERIQDDDTDSNQDEDELAVGTKVSARW
ncbi:unnamed protein product [Mytilus coruscus]|uniref:Uncharacterized protein n=1 Tax=Mytilus coruscus TaxID=42192 RepID=A0A6J8EVI6_MYTCO|nr:unnamed protein product [Mytilus coruscus]